MKILVISLSNLGDAILTYPAIEAIRQKFPEAELHVLASPNTKEFFAGDTAFRKVWVWEKKGSLIGRAVLVVKLMAARYSLVVDFKDTMIPLVLFGAKRTPILRKFPAGVHRLEQHLALVERIGAPRPAVFPKLPFGPEEELAVEGWLASAERGGAFARFATIVPGAKSHLKRWAPSKFAQVADRFAEEHNMRILLIGGEEDSKEAEAVRHAMKHPALNLCGKTTIRQLAALLSRVSLVITNDTANLHAAQAMGAPTVAIFGPTDEKKYGPRNPNSMVVRRSLICAPCEKALCAYDHECMKWIEPEEVYSAALKLLEKA